MRGQFRSAEIRATARQVLPRCTSRTGCTTRTVEQVIRIVYTIRTCPHAADGAMGNNPSAKGQYRMQGIHKRVRSGRWPMMTD